MVDHENRNQYTEEQLLKFKEGNKRARIHKNGNIYQSKLFGDYEIIGREANSLVIRFLETGHVKKVDKSKAGNGHVKDVFYPSVYGVGYFGVGPYSSKTHPKIYTKWNDMVKRCYSEKWHVKKPTYISCEVAKEWHNFQVFAKDFEEMCLKFNIKDLDGISLDKDIAGDGKIYSKETCILCTVSENSKERNNRSSYKYNPNNIAELKGGGAE